MVVGMKEPADWIKKKTDKSRIKRGLGAAAPPGMVDSGRRSSNEPDFILYFKMKSGVSGLLSHVKQAGSDIIR